MSTVEGQPRPDNDQSARLRHEIDGLLTRFDEVRLDHSQIAFTESPSEPAEHMEVDYRNVDETEARILVAHFGDFPDLLERVKGNPLLRESVQAYVARANWYRPEYRERIQTALESFDDGSSPTP